MFKATSTFTHTRNIAMALTMAFAVTACGNDDSSDASQSPEAEISSENQNNVTEDYTATTSDTADTMEKEVVPEPEPADTTAASEPADPPAASADTTANDDASASGDAQTHVVNAEGLIFNPLVVKINPGDTVSWRNMSTHNSESIDGLIPEGAEKWNSPMSQNYQRTFTQEGIYVYKCTPHIGTGMGGAIIVGNPVNLEQIKSADVTGAAGRLVRKAISEAESM